MSLSLVNSINAEDGLYNVLDNGQVIESFEDYEDAKEYFNDYQDEYDNLLITYNDKVIDMEYGFVSFNDNVLEYYSLDNDQTSYLDGVYVGDGAYLKTYDNGQYVKAYLNGELLKIDIDSIELIPYRNNLLTSIYEVKDQCLYHHINNDLNNDYYTEYLLLDNNFNLLVDGYYYSYDGIYFYDDYHVMIDDYRNNSNDNSLNEAYYNYFEYLPAHAISSYSLQDLNYYLDECLNINSSIKKYEDKNNDGANDVVDHSMLYGLAKDYKASEDIYGVNSIYNLAISIKESNYGKSLLSFKNNNLYLNSAYNSGIAKSEGRYSKVSDSVINFARYYINKLYSSYRKDNYKGTHFGNRNSGISYDYSLDPYFGEKCASVYLKIDNTLANKDLNNYCLLISKQEPISLYYDEELNRKAYTLNNNSSLSFVVLKESESAYEVLSDNTLSNEQVYNVEDNKLYIDKEDVLTIINKDKIKDLNTSEIKYDFNGGTYSLLKQVSVNVLNTEDLSIEPSLDGYEFVDYQLEDDVWIAQYKKIKDISLYTPFRYNVYLNENLDLSNGKIKVTYEDGSNKIIDITTDMVNKIDSSELGYQEVTITYNGLSLTKEIEIIEKQEDVYEKMSYQELRKVDSDNLKNSKYAYRIDSDNEDLSVSGMSYALKSPLIDSIFGDTYYCVIKKGSKLSDSFNKMIETYDLEVIDNIDISFKLNYTSLKLQEPVIISKAIEHEPYKAYGVYRIENNQIVKVDNEWSNNQISFKAEESGHYVILKTNFNNEYDIEDIKENVRSDTNGFDNHLFIRETFTFIVLVLLDLIAVIYYIIKENELEASWRDFRKLLPIVASAQEEKLKN